MEKRSSNLRIGASEKAVMSDNRDKFVGRDETSWRIALAFPFRSVTTVHRLRDEYSQQKRRYMCEKLQLKSQGKYEPVHEVAAKIAAAQLSG